MTGAIHSNLAVVQGMTGHYTEAQQNCEKGISIKEKSGGPEYQYDTGLNYCNLARIQLMNKDHDGVCIQTSSLFDFGLEEKKMIKKFFVPRIFMLQAVATRLRSLRSDDPLNKGHPRSIKQELETFKTFQTHLRTIKLMLLSI